MEWWETIWQAAGQKRGEDGGGTNPPRGKSERGGEERREKGPDDPVSWQLNSQPIPILNPL